MPAGRAPITPRTFWQVTQLQSMMQEETVRAGQTIWARGEVVHDVLLVGEGQFHFNELPMSKSHPFEQGALLADVFALEQPRKTHRLTFSALTDGKVFRIDGFDLFEFLEQNLACLCTCRTPSWWSDRPSAGGATECGAGAGRSTWRSSLYPHVECSTTSFRM